MASASTIQRDSLTSSQVPEYHNFLFHMIPYIPADLRSYAEELCKYFETHHTDPYSCVISQRPTKSVCCHFFTFKSLNSNQQACLY